VLSGRQVRDTVTPHPLIRIRGTREARELAEGLVILGGLNDGAWPQLPPPDPWLNRQMRLAAGLLLPERRIGLSAHDFQQAIAAPEVVLTRAGRNDEAECIPSRWLNRLLNLMAGLPDRGGPEALKAMRARGAGWLALARSLDVPDAETARNPRPSPCPPVAHRPRELSVTRIETLIRDPYAIYAQYLLRLSALNPLRPEPDARLRGTVLHKVMEAYARAAPFADTNAARAALLSAADSVMLAEVPWPAARALWLARIARVADWVVAQDEAQGGTPVLLEKKGAMVLADLGFTLTARPDRIDRLPDGRLHIFDYKTGDPPSEKQMAYFNQQLALQAIMAAEGGFAALGPAEVEGATYVGLGASRKTRGVDVSDAALAQVRARLHDLIVRYQQEDTGYTAQRAVFKLRFENDYAGVSRFGEWELSDPSVPLPVGTP
jgi:ATP-dependent helicase/nuclease subunit B